jgi:predicted dithiol-disulfide oxidoreductase (DUF899 family)
MQAAEAEMSYQDTAEKLATYRRQIPALRDEMRELQARVEPQPVEDYALATVLGPVRLSQLFGDKDTLFVIHNMGAGCRYCTLWADGFNGVLPHLENRAAFVVCSPDAPEQQEKFKSSRNWRFRMVSHQGSPFAEDMGYKGETGWLPGVSVFRKRNGRLVRVSDTRLGPGDDFCVVWHLFDLMPEGPAGWQPQYKYS